MDKQSLAKIGVVLLLAANVGGYYYFWPRHHHGRTTAAARSTANGENQEKGDAKIDPQPKPIEARTVSNATLPIIPEPSLPGIPPLPGKSDADALAIANLLRQIGKEKPELPTLPAPESADGDVTPRAVPDDLPRLPREVSRSNPEIAIASPLMPQPPRRLWMVQTEKSSNGTQLTARLRDAAGERVIADFRIRCDRVETADNGDMRATGNVSFVGAGWKGTCRSLTIPIGQPRLVFERDVEIAQDVLGSSQDGGLLRGEQIVWELPAPASAGLTLPLQPR